MSNSNTYESVIQQVLNKIIVIVAFIPIYEFVKHVWAERVKMITIVAAHVEPHGYEHMIQQLQDAENSDVVFFNDLGFENTWIGVS